MGYKMKKYIVLFLMCLPMVSFGAPSVRALGSGAVVGASGAAASKITPVKAGSTPSASSVARVGSLRSKATTAGIPSTVSGSTGRFPVISTAKVYNTAAAPRPVSYSSTTINNTEAVDLTGIEQKIEQNKNNIQNNTTNIATNTENITNNTTNISNNTTRIEALEGDADTVLVSGSGNPFTGNPQNENRAWIWVEK